MATRVFDLKKTRMGIFEAVIDASNKYGSKKIIIEDIERKPLDYNKLIIASLVLGEKLKQKTTEGETIGILIASSIGGVASLLGLLAFGRTVAMLNFTAGPKNIRSACEATRITKIITAKRFIEKAGLEHVIDELKKDIEIIYLEDVKAEIGLLDKLKGVANKLFVKNIISKPDPDSPAIILFTSGTEGAPKGVALSHANYISNVMQITTHVNMLPSYKIFNPLPIFHSLGLTGGVILPLLAGLRTFLFPSPLQGKNIVKLIKETESSILFSTDTFINQYGRLCSTDELKSLAFVVCGAERVKPETREFMQEKHGVMLLEGYGATEAAPVVAVNQPENNHTGSVGQLMPGMQWKLESVPGINGGGRLYIKGPNIMMGYIRVDAPGEIQKLPDGWHDTGDIVSIDENGFVYIKGRLKRFAKIGGEMVSLTAVEGYASALWPDNHHIAVTVNDPKKGEQIILLTNKKDIEKSEMQNWYKLNGAPEIALPKLTYYIEEIPILSTGKSDYVAAQKLAETIDISKK